MFRAGLGVLGVLGALGDNHQLNRFPSNLVDTKLLYIPDCYRSFIVIGSQGGKLYWNEHRVLKAVNTAHCAFSHFMTFIWTFPPPNYFSQRPGRV